MSNLRTYRKTPKCPFYGFYYSDDSDELQLIPVNDNNCALRRFFQTLSNNCIMDEKFTMEEFTRKEFGVGPYFPKCEIAKDILKMPGTWDKIQKSNVLTFNLDSEKKGAFIVPFGIWFKHVLEGVSLDSLIEKY